MNDHATTASAETLDLAAIREEISGPHNVSAFIVSRLYHAAKRLIAEVERLRSLEAAVGVENTIALLDKMQPGAPIQVVAIPGRDDVVRVVRERIESLDQTISRGHVEPGEFVVSEQERDGLAAFLSFAATNALGYTAAIPESMRAAIGDEQIEPLTIKVARAYYDVTDPKASIYSVTSDALPSVMGGIRQALTMLQEGTLLDAPVVGAATVPLQTSDRNTA